MAAWGNRVLLLLTTPWCVGKISNIKAKAIINRRVTVAENAFAELAVWALDGSVPPCGHPYKYRLAFVVDGMCVLRYGNERGKGDHRHIGSVEAVYAFEDVDRLVADFFNDVKEWLDEHAND